MLNIRPIERTKRVWAARWCSWWGPGCYVFLRHMRPGLMYKLACQGGSLPQAGYLVCSWAQRASSDAGAWLALAQWVAAVCALQKGQEGLSWCSKAVFLVYRYGRFWEIKLEVQINQMWSVRPLADQYHSQINQTYADHTRDRLWQCGLARGIRWDKRVS